MTDSPYITSADVTLVGDPHRLTSANVGINSAAVHFGMACLWAPSSTALKQWLLEGLQAVEAAENRLHQANQPTLGPVA